MMIFLIRTNQMRKTGTTHFRVMKEDSTENL